MDGFIEGSFQLVFAQWLLQQNSNLFLLDCVSLKLAEQQFSIGTRLELEDWLVDDFIQGSS
jgi:hypothetical protein